MTHQEQYWSVKEIAQRMRCTTDSVKKQFAKGLRRQKFGGRTLISETDLQAYIASSTAGTSAKQGQAA